jgi:hypothetical protein
MGSDSLVLIPVAVLALLSLVRFSTCGPSLIRAFAVCLVVFGGFLLLRFAVPDDLIWPNSEVARRNRWLRNHLEKTADWERKPLVILSGSSSTYYGIDAGQLEKNLVEMGTPATVLSFSMPGNTHAERQYMLEQFLNGLPRDIRDKLEKADVLFLGEVFDEYDRNPLYRFSKDSFTQRTIQFLNPGVATQAWEAYAKQLESEPGLPRLGTMGLLFQHVLLNRFCAGAFSEMRPTIKFRKTPPFFPLGGSKDTFNYEEAVQNMKNPQDGSQKVSGLPFPQWIISDSQLRKAMTPYVDQHGYYCLPVLERARAAYQRSFLASLSTDTPAIGAPDTKENDALNRKEYWFDGVHPTGDGAREVTRRFAERLAEMLPTVLAERPDTKNQNEP